MVDRDVVLAKVATIDRCLGRIAQTRGERRAVLLPVEIEDLVILNLQRAVQAAIDLATHAVTTEAYGLPDSVASSFSILERHGVLDAELARRLRPFIFKKLEVGPVKRAGAIVSSDIGQLRHSPDHS